MDNVLTRFFEQLRGANAGSKVSIQSKLKDDEARAPRGVRTPTSDVFESDSRLLLIVDLPGSKREDIEVALEGETLTLRAPIGELEPGYAWQRSFWVPRVDVAKAHASWALGVLKIELPRLKSEARRIPLSTAA
jgi:HSP20 family molecular chaperone IbpA